MKLLVSDSNTAFLFIFHGSSNLQTNDHTVNTFVNHFKDSFRFDKYVVYFTSRIVRLRMSHANNEILSLDETLSCIKSLGYTSIVIVFSNIIYGSVVKANLDIINECQVTFDHMVIMKGLLEDDKDIERVGDILINHFNEPTLMLGHGQQNDHDSYYQQLDTYLSSHSTHRCLSLKSTLLDFQEHGRTQITVFPFLLMLGHHARSDIAIKLKANLKEVGIDMSMIEQSVIDVESILDYYVEKTKKESRVLFNEEN